MRASVHSKSSYCKLPSIQKRNALSLNGNYVGTGGDHQQEDDEERNSRPQPLKQTRKTVTQRSQSLAGRDVVIFSRKVGGQKSLGSRKRRPATQKKEFYRYCILPGNNSRAVINAFRSRPWWATFHAKPAHHGGGGGGPRGPCSKKKPSSAPSGLGQQEASGRQDPAPEWDLLWEMYRNPKRIKQIPSGAKKALNHFDNNGCLVTKKGLYKSLKAFVAKRPDLSLESIIPQTFYLSSSVVGAELGADDEEQQEEAEERAAFLEICRAEEALGRDCFWIVKPASMSNRGMGIEVKPGGEEVLALVDRPLKSGDRRRFGWIVQRYMMNPLLVRGRKFDVRCWVLLVARPPPPRRRGSGGGGGKRRPGLAAHLFREGYVRTSSARFDARRDRLGDKFIHLTNDAVQNKGKDYGKYEAGNKMSFEEFQAYIDETYDGKANYVEEHMLPGIKELARLSVEAVALEINKSRRKCCFELLGYDFMIDDNFQISLIEVNSNPCLEFSSPMLEDYITNLLSNVIEIAVDSIFLPPKKYQEQYHTGRTFQVFENKLELIYDDIRSNDAEDIDGS